LNSGHYTNSGLKVNRRGKRPGKGLNPGASRPYNSAVKGISAKVIRKGMTLLVQTQDVPGASSYIETLVYGSGRLIYSRRTPILSPRQSAAWPDRLNKLLADAQKSVLDDLAAGRLDGRLLEPGR
jgi:hypothetical protein